MKMKKKIAKILRRWADKISPEGKYLPPLNCKVGELKLLCVGYQYPKDAKMLDFDMIRYRLTQLIAKDLVCNRAILFTITMETHTSTQLKQSSMLNALKM